MPKDLPHRRRRKDPRKLNAPKMPLALVSSTGSDIGNSTEAPSRSQTASFISSRLFGYVLCKRLDGFPGAAGTTAWWTNRVFKGYGACDERFLPSGTVESEDEVLKVKIAPEAFRDARKHRCFAYQRIYTINDVKRALIHFAPLPTPLTPIVCFDVFEGLYSTPSGRVPLPQSGDSRIGGHCVLITGYDDYQRVFHFLNLSGMEWGENGTLPYEYFTRKLISEAWIMYPHELKRVFSKPHWNNVFRDKVHNRVSAIITEVRALAWGRPSLWVIDFYDRECELLGWLHCTAFVDRDILEIEELFIKPEYRQRGLGTKLLELAKSLAGWCVVSKIGVWIPNQDVIPGRKKTVRALYSRSGIRLKRNATKSDECYCFRGEEIISKGQ
jgi:GNAT superfamily N-acetyltransferase